MLIYKKNDHRLNLSLEGETALRVGDLNTESLGLVHDGDSLSRRNVVGDLSSVGLGVEEQKVDVGRVGDKERLVAGRSHVAGLLVGAVSDLWHGDGTSESSSNAGVDTLWLSP